MAKNIPEVKMLKEILKKSIEAKEKVLEDKKFFSNFELAVETIANAFKNNKKILIMGNGGSAADAQHFAGELINRFLMERAPLPAIALSTDTSVLTCIGNDYSFDIIFKKQIEALGNKGDILFGITSSGNSVNILEAFKAGKEKGLINIGLLGKDGGKAKDLCDIPLIVNNFSTPRIQEIHITIIHIICEIVEKNLFNK